MPEPIDEFTVKVKELIDKWNAEWKEGNSVRPDEFPLEMDSGQWYEQLLIYFSTDD